MKKYDYDTNLNNDLPKEEQVQNFSKPKEISFFQIMVVIIVILVASGFFLSRNKSENTPQNQEIVKNTNGDFSCTKYHNKELDKLEPDKLLKAEIESLNDKQERLKREIDFMNAKENVYLYNSKVDEYNSRIIVIKNKSNDYSSQVNKYNNYLVKNCTKK